MKQTYLIAGALTFAGLLFARYQAESNFFYSRDVSGTVVARDKRLANDQGKPYEKVSLRLNPFEADSAVKNDAEGVQGLDVECISTKCTLLNNGDCVLLACKRDVRFFEPNIIECKAIKTIECKNE